jgi:hypothetical protein
MCLALLTRLLCVAGQVQVVGPVTPANLVGEWYKSKISTIDFVNPKTGGHASPSGDRLNVRFNADGTFKMGELIQSSLYSCTTSVFGYRIGTYQISNSTIDIRISSNTLTSKDNCHPQWNYEKHLSLGRTVYRAQLGRSQYGPVLILTNPQGKQEIYAREKGEGVLKN